MGGNELSALGDTSDRPASRSSMLSDLLRTHESQTDLLDPIASDPPAAPLPRTEQSKAREPRSLFGEILDFMLAPLLLLWPLTIIITLIVARSLSDAPYDLAMRDKTLMLAQQIQFVEDGSQTIVRVPDTVHDLIGRDNGLLRYQVLDSEGQAVFGDPMLPRPSLYDYPELGKVNYRTVPWNEQDFRLAYTYVPVRGREDASQPVLVQVAETFDARNRLANSIIKGVIIPQFFILPIAAALVWFGLSRGLRPLRGLRDRIRARRPDDLSPIDPKSAPHEIAPLVDSFNEVLTQLDTTLNTQRRFIADAAHQIKTPLAGIRMQAELAMREKDPEERNRSLNHLARSSERTSHLINQLLALARAENLGDTTRFERVELNGLVREVLAELAPLALDSQLDIGFEASASPAWINANPILLGELIQNLATNAIRYSPANGLINVRVNFSLGACTLEVEDNGPGIPQAERQAVFDRFYRLRDRPARDVGQERGSGLGLAIVREIARLHRAQVSIRDGIRWPAERGDGCGTCFVVQFAPLDDPAGHDRAL